MKHVKKGLMGFKKSLFISCVTLCFLCWLRGTEAMENSTLRSLDDVFQEYAVKSLPRQHQTGVLYNASLPSNFSGIEVSIVRLRRDSFFAKGANYSGFDMPPKIFSQPYFTRLDIVYSNLGNYSSYYYNVPNYTLVAPVVGFNIYGSRIIKGQIGNLSIPATRLNLTLLGDPILVKFPNLSLPPDEKAKCVMFYLDGMVEMTEMTLHDACVVQDQGHFSIVMATPPPSPPIQPVPKEHKRRGKLWKWWVIGFGMGVLGVLLFGFIIFMVIRFFRGRKIERMEKEAEKNEGLDTTNVGLSRMPSASVVRTQPEAIESDYFP